MQKEVYRFCNCIKWLSLRIQPISPLSVLGEQTKLEMISSDDA